VLCQFLVSTYSRECSQLKVREATREEFSFFFLSKKGERYARGMRRPPLLLRLWPGTNAIARHCVPLLLWKPSPGRPRRGVSVLDLSVEQGRTNGFPREFYLSCLSSPYARTVLYDSINLLAEQMHDTSKSQARCKCRGPGLGAEVHSSAVCSVVVVRRDG